MKWPWTKDIPIEVEQKNTSVLDRIVAAALGSITSVTPGNCLKSPTMRSIVTGISGRIASMPVHVYQTNTNGGRESKEQLPNHPVAKLLKYPNNYQSAYDYWQDAISAFLRHGCFIAVKGQGSTGPIRNLFPLVPSETEVKQKDNLDIYFKHKGVKEYDSKKVHYVRGPSSDFYSPESIVKNISVAIGVEIAAENHSASFFKNGAIPLIIFQQLAAFSTPEDQQKFISDFQEKYTGDSKFRAMMLPKNIDLKDPINIDHQKAQLNEIRKHQSVMIAAAFGIPPHVVGILDNAHYNNIEQQEQDLLNTVLLPIVQNFERAMERDLLTQSDRNSGVKIRFNMNAIQRADFKTQQEGLEKQLINGVITPNMWAERLGYNPISKDDGGDQYYHSANIVPVMQEPPQGANPNDPNNPPDPTGNQGKPPG